MGIVKERRILRVIETTFVIGQFFVPVVANLPPDSVMFRAAVA